MWRLKTMLLNNQWVKEENQTEIKKYSDTNENRNATHQNMRWSKSSSNRELHTALRIKKDLK